MMYLFRVALIVSAAALMAGCSGSAPPISSPAVVPQREASQAGVHRTTGSSGDLLYVVTSFQADVLTYPGLKKNGTLTPQGFLGFGTTDPNNGDVFFDNRYNVYEYAYGGSKPIASIDPPSSQQFAYFDCAIDPTNDAIAVTADKIGTSGGYIAIYATPYSTPAIYSDPNIATPLFVGYDNNGNLFVDGYGYGYSGGYVLAELPKGASTFTDITLNAQPRELASIQWDGSYMTVRSGTAIYRFTVSGSSGTIVGKTALKAAWGTYNSTFWIQGDTVIAAHLSGPGGKHNGRYLGFWHYPEGGKAFKIITTLSKNKKDTIDSVVIAAAPSRSRTRR